MKKNETLGCEKKFKKFLEKKNSFEKPNQPTQPISVKKNDTLGCEKKIQKKIYLQNFFLFSHNFGKVANQFG